MVEPMPRAERSAIGRFGQDDGEGGLEAVYPREAWPARLVKIISQKPLSMNGAAMLQFAASLLSPQNGA